MKHAGRPFIVIRETPRMSSVVGIQASPKRTIPLAPREHGFWVMLGVVVLSALSRVGRTGSAWVVAIAVVIIAIALGSIVGRRIRRSGALQLTATGALSLAGVPIQLAAGARPLNAALDGCTWITVFAASALAVRACFARGSRRDRGRTSALTWGSILVPLSAAGLFVQFSLRPQALATLVAGIGTAGIALFRPTAKHLKAVGIALATLAVVAAVFLHVS